MGNKQLLMKLIDKYGIDRVFYVVDRLSNLIFFTDDITWATTIDEDEYDVYERVSIVYNAADCIRNNNDISTEFYTLHNFETKEYRIIDLICAIKNLSDQQIIEKYKDVLHAWVKYEE